MYKSTINIVLNKINRFLFIAVLLELFMGGGGRITEFGFLTLRMILFFLMIAINIPVFLISKKINKYVIELMMIFTLYLIFYCTIGFFNNISFAKIFEDIKPLTYFYSMLFFYNNINEWSDIKYIIKILKISSLIMAVVYIFIYFIMNLGIVDFSTIYSALSISDEFYFRGEHAFFYKGFFYLCIGFIFFVSENNVSSKYLSILIFIAIILTFTRGFILSLIVSYIILELFFKKVSVKTLFILVFNIFILVMIFSFFTTQEIGDKTVSDNIRLTTIRQVYETTGFVSSFIGHGFGQGVAIRKIHMEISFLEIFHKQGLFGLFLWLYIFVLIVKFYNQTVKNKNNYYAKPLLISSIFVYVVSFTNPFINNPIGMSMLIISMIGLNILGNERKNHDICLHPYL
ncbi:MAG: hypothetical protein HYY40_01985 [Bacteroidetes bacterium]|nr:hypothetical protein [Bacteroidota bacterium]